MQHMILVILYFVALISCSPKSLFDEQEKVITDFPKTIKINGEKMDLDILGIVDIHVVDTFLIAYTPMHSDYYCQLYSTNNHRHIGNFFPVGRGPNEFYAISYHRCEEIDSDGIKAWYSNSLEQYQWNITKSISQDTTIIDSIIQLKGILSEDIWFPNTDGTMVGFQRTSDNIQYVQYKKEEIHKFNIFPEKISKEILPLTFMEPYLKPDKTKIAFMGSYTNHFCIFNTDFTDFHAYSIGSPISLVQASQKDENDRTLFYSNCQITNSYIYGIYLNFEEEARHYHPGNEEIHIFDWNGHPILKIVIPENIMFFAVDEKHQCLYGLMSNEQIYKYDLSEYLTVL